MKDRTLRSARANASAGFTLLEVLVALAVVAVGVAAAVQATAGHADRAARIEARVLSLWVAGNRLSELRLARAWPSAGETSGVASQGGRDWYYAERYTTTDDPDLRRVDIHVYDDPDHERERGYLFGYLARP